MRIPALMLMALASLVLLAAKPDKPAFMMYDANGKKTNYEKMLKEAMKADVVLFGELHDNPIAHWLQLELSKDMHTQLLADGRTLVLGAEMFEADGQVLLDEYLQGMVDQRNFEQQARLWPNYKTDYKPLIEFAKGSGLPFIATNVPRRYAAIVNRKGFEGLDSLPQDAYHWIAPLPIIYDPELPAYKDMLEMSAGHGKVNENLPRAQALKDATMAYFIRKNLKEGSPFMHFHGAYHSDNGQGITWYLKQSDPGLRILTISTVVQEDVDSLAAENQGRADFVICVAESMTRTH